MTPAHRQTTLWKVSIPGTAPQLIRAANWLQALGDIQAASGMPSLGDRIACERLRNGTIIINDMSLRRRYVVEPQVGLLELPASLIQPLEDDDTIDDTLLDDDALLEDDDLLEDMDTEEIMRPRFVAVPAA